MSPRDKRLETLVLKLFEIEAIKFGDYKLKNGTQSPIYIDLRVIVSHPEVLETISDLLYESGLEGNECEHVCGVPYTALPIATVISIKSKLPMLIRRKEMKDYGTKKMIEGQFKVGDRCVIIEDVITSGSSVIETANTLSAEGLRVDYALVILDRQQGGRDNLLKHGIKVTSLFTMRQVLDILVNDEKITISTADIVDNYLRTSQTSSVPAVASSDRLKMSFNERMLLTENILTKRLFQLMLDKRTNLCIAADLVSSAEILELFDKVGPYTCIFKTHIDIIEDYNDEFVNKLSLLAKKHNVILMEDRKFSDIGNTVALQYTRGIYKVSEWADLVTIHSVPGPGVINGIKSVLDNKIRGVFVVAEMSSQDNLMTPEYTNSSFKMYENESDIVVGFVCQSKNIIKSPKFIQLTPGVKLHKSKDNLGQNYNSPEEVILNKGADIAVVGRGITNAADPKKEAKIYRDVLWKCYEDRIKS